MSLSEFPIAAHISPLSAAILCCGFYLVSSVKVLYKAAEPEGRAATADHGAPLSGCSPVVCTALHKSCLTDCFQVTWTPELQELSPHHPLSPPINPWFTMV